MVMMHCLVVEGKQKIQNNRVDVFSHQEKEFIEICYKRDNKWQGTRTKDIKHNFSSKCNQAHTTFFYFTVW